MFSEGCGIKYFSDYFSVEIFEALIVDPNIVNEFLLLGILWKLPQILPKIVTVIYRTKTFHASLQKMNEICWKPFLNIVTLIRMSIWDIFVLLSLLNIKSSEIFFDK